jgi:S-adenosylmethionine-diacylglycerol 3-amino-3-carboxypropyl transferase
LPLYLAERNFACIRERAARVSVEQVSVTAKLRAFQPASVDRYVLLDAQDWMNDDQLNELWQEITRTAKPGARVIFRTAGRETILTGRVVPEIMNRWTYEQKLSEHLNSRDRSSIYGGFHLYVLDRPTA